MEDNHTVSEGEEEKNSWRPSYRQIFSAKSQGELCFWGLPIDRRKHRNKFMFRSTYGIEMIVMYESKLVVKNRYNGLELMPGTREKNLQIFLHLFVDPYWKNVALLPLCF